MGLRDWIPRRWRPGPGPGQHTVSFATSPKMSSYLVAMARCCLLRRADIVWHHRDTGETQIWFMDGHQLVRRATVLGEDGNPAFVGLPFEIVGVGEG